MSFLVDISWLQRVSYLHEGFEWVVPSRVAKCRCKICGDSQKNRRKKRGHFYTEENELKYKCHNCGESMSFSWYVKTVLPELNAEYRLDKFKGAATTAIPIQQQLAEPVIVAELEAPSCDLLPSEHKAVEYLKSRAIPISSYSRIKFVTNFRDWVFKQTKISRYSKIPDDARIVFEMRDVNGRLFGVQGRSINPNSSMRYITLKFDEGMPKLYGLDAIRTDCPILVVEGAIDSLFLPNSLALCGGDVTTSIEKLPKDRTFIVLDNEPRKFDTVSRMEKAISMGYKVCFWQIDPLYKDINDMILKGNYSSKDIIMHIIQNSFSGPQATVMLSKWRKIRGTNVRKN